MSKLGGKVMSEDTDRSSDVASVVAGSRITVDATDPRNPIVTADVQAGGQVDSVVGGTNCSVDATDPVNPIVNADTQNNAKVTTKGDIEGFSTVAARIPVGTNDQVLTADSTQALGLKWATPAAGGGGVSAGRVSKTTDTGMDNTFAALVWGFEDYDDDGFIDLGASNTRLTVPTGVTRVNVQAYIRPLTSSYTTGDYLNTYIRHFNSSSVLQANVVVDVNVKDAGGAIFGHAVALGIPCVATDYFEIWLIPEDTAWTLTEAHATIQDVSP